MNTVDFNNLGSEVIIAAIIGFVIGIIVMAIIGRSSKGKQSAQTAKVQSEYDHYREQVNAHFAKTADTIDNLTKSYQDVFDHLSHGAQHLMDKQALQEQLAKRQGKAVTLAYLVDDKNEGKSSRKPKVSKISTESVVANKTQDKIEPMVKKEAPVSPVEKVDMVTDAKNLKTEAESALHQQTTSVASQQKKNNQDSTLADQAQPADSQGKSQVHIAAEKAGLKPAAKIIDDKHETAIDSVRKHIKDNHGKRV